jgi:hypothetical protein
MTFVAIPDWSPLGVLPPINVLSPTSGDRSPYKVSLTDFILRFNTSEERSRILEGYLRYRKAFHDIGLISGFQWIDGSFLEQIEILEGRSPRDIDVVTFFNLPHCKSQIDVLGLNPRLFKPECKDEIKNEFHVDGQFVLLSAPPGRLVDRSAYWYSVWGHRREGTWKGFLQIDLSQAEDATALANLNGMGVVA